MAFTVKATQAGTVITTGTSILVEVLRNTALAQPAASTTNQSSSAYSKAITTTVTGSVVYGAVGGSASTLLATASSTIIAQAAQNSFQLGAVKATSATGTPGSVTIGASNTFLNVGVGLFEVLPNGTITLDGSTPALATANANSATTAAFTPPPGSLLVALVVAASSAATITDTSGLGLVWTLKNTGTFTDGFAGVYIARVPFGLPPGQPRLNRRSVRGYRRAVPVPSKVIAVTAGIVPVAPRSRPYRPRTVRRATAFVPAVIPPVVVFPPPQLGRTTRPAMRRLRKGSATQVPAAIETVAQPSRSKLRYRRSHGSGTLVPTVIVPLPPIPPVPIPRRWALRGRRILHATPLPTSAAPPPATPSVRRTRYRRQRGAVQQIPGGIGAVFQPLPALSLYRRVFRFRRSRYAAPAQFGPEPTIPIQPNRRTTRYRKPSQSVVAPPAPQVVTPAQPAPYEPRNRTWRIRIRRSNIHQLPGPTTTPSVAAFAPYAPTRIRTRWYRRKSNATTTPVPPVTVPVAPTVPDTHRMRRIVLLRRIRPPQLPGQPRATVVPYAPQTTRKGQAGRTRRARSSKLVPFAPEPVVQPRASRRSLPKRRITIPWVPSPPPKPPPLPVAVVKRLAQRFWRSLQRKRRATELPGPTIAPIIPPPPEDIGCTISTNALAASIVVLGYAIVLQPDTVEGSAMPIVYGVTITVVTYGGTVEPLGFDVTIVVED